MTLTNAQQNALDNVDRCGRYGIGPYGGMRWPTAKRLQALGLIRIEYEHKYGRTMAFAYKAT